MPRIFISYRRQDSQAATGRIGDRLRAHFGNDAIFMDIDSIPFGEDFRQHIDTAVGTCDVVLAVIGSKWAGETDAHRRLDDPGDFVRIELESALNRNIPLIPILIDHAKMPGEADLPASLAKLAYRNAMDLDQGRDFHSHVDRLIRAIESHFQKSSGVATHVRRESNSAASKIKPPQRKTVLPPDTERKPVLPDPRHQRSDTQTAAPQRQPALKATNGSQHHGLKLKVAAGLLALAGLFGIVLYIATDNGTVKITPKVPAPDPGKREPPNPAPSAPTAKPAAKSQPEEITTRVGHIKLRLIPAGTFSMGSPDGVGENDERPQHQVRITRPFYLGVYEVTQAQYRAVTTENPSYFSSAGDGKGAVAGRSTDHHPVESVSWLDAVKFCNLLSDKEGLKRFYEIEGDTARVPDWSAMGYRLPTEAEWEYACRAGSAATYSFGDDQNQLGEYAWFIPNTDDDDPDVDNDTRTCTHPVGEKRRNGFWLYDMHGNVCEWCWDWYGQTYYKESPPADPRGPDKVVNKDVTAVFRGGCSYFKSGPCRSARRMSGWRRLRAQFLGLRVARGQSGG